MELIELLRNNARLAFGVACLVLALALLLGWGLARLRQTLRRRKRPDLRQRSGGEAYHGEQSGLRRSVPLTEQEAHYTGERRRRQGKADLPYSGIPSYKRGRAAGRSSAPRSFWNPTYHGSGRKKTGSAAHSFWNPAYTGRRGGVWNHPQVRAVTLALLAVILAAVYGITRYLLPDLVTPAWAAEHLFWAAALVVLLPVLWGRAAFSLIALTGYLAGLALGELLGDAPALVHLLSGESGAHCGWLIASAVFLLSCALGALVQHRLSREA
ncbi:MAG: hypothetical protein LIO45_07970 [Clostridiales bacterium]|nr:hypothetical protein [Clostridiales bacterium]